MAIRVRVELMELSAFQLLPKAVRSFIIEQLSIYWSDIACMAIFLLRCDRNVLIYRPTDCATLHNGFLANVGRSNDRNMEISSLVNCLSDRSPVCWSEYRPMSFLASTWSDKLVTTLAVKRGDILAKPTFSHSLGRVNIRQVRQTIATSVASLSRSLHQCL